MRSATPSAAPCAEGDPREHGADDRGVGLEADADVRREESARRGSRASAPRPSRRTRSRRRAAAGCLAGRPSAGAGSATGSCHGSPGATTGSWPGSTSCSLAARPEPIAVDGDVAATPLVGGHVGGDSASSLRATTRAVGGRRDDGRVAWLTALVRHRVGVDGREAPVVADHLERRRGRLDRLAGVGVREAIMLRRRGRPHRHAVLGDDAR